MSRAHLGRQVHGFQGDLQGTGWVVTRVADPAGANPFPTCEKEIKIKPIPEKLLGSDLIDFTLNFFFRYERQNNLTLTFKSLCLDWIRIWPFFENQIRVKPGCNHDWKSNKFTCVEFVPIPRKKSGSEQITHLLSWIITPQPSKDNESREIDVTSGK